MERFFKGIRAFLPHLIIAMSITLLTLSVTDHFNTAMAFINHPMTKALLLIYGLLSLAVCLTLSMGGTVGRIIPSLICGAVTVGLLAALLYDRIYPREILFTKDFGKILIFADTIVSLILAAYSAKLNRNAAARDYRKWTESNEELRKGN